MNHSPRSLIGRFLRLMFPIVLEILILSYPNPLVAVQTIPNFGGEKSSWHGFDRYDFILDTTTLAVMPFKSFGEGNGVKDPEKGQRRCILVVPKNPAAGNPWSWLPEGLRITRMGDRNSLVVDYGCRVQ